MKTLIYPLLFIFLWSCNGSKKLIEEQINHPEISQAVHNHLSEFELAVKNHDQEKVMSLLDKAYVKEQHDGFLGGRTEQFLNELLCGEPVSEGKFKCPGFNNISQIKLVKMEKNDDLYHLSYQITADGVSYKAWLGLKVKETNPENYSILLFGAVG